MTGYPGVLGDVRRLFPNINITSGYRGPNSPLTRANPSSRHAHGSPDNPGAFDVAPMPGLSFDQYVGRLKQAGIPVTGALDEAAHPTAWTTGPNWHVSLDTASQRANPYYQKAQDADMASRAANFNVNIPPGMAQPNLGDTPLSPQIDASSILNNLPALKSHPNRGKIIGNILGVLGDSLMAYGGLSPQFGPNLARQQADERQMTFERDKFNALLEAKRQEALAPPSWLKDADTFAKLPPAEQQKVAQFYDVRSPMLTDISTPQGVFRQQVPRSVPGQAPPEAINDLRSAVASGDNAAIDEFDEVFGPGAARRYLGQ